MNDKRKPREQFPAVPPRFHYHVLDVLQNLPTEKEIIRMNKQSLRRGLVLAVVTALLMSTVVYGASKIYSTVSRVDKSDGGYKAAPTSQTLDRDIGVAAVIPSTLSGGYVYQEGYVGQTEQMDESGQVIERFKDFGCQYVKDGMLIFLSVQNAVYEHATPEMAHQVFDRNGISIGYMSYTTKLAPPGYVKTEQEKAEEAAGKLNFGYAGDAEISVEQQQLLWWEQNGVFYQLATTDNPLTAHELVDIAGEIISSK